MDTKSSTSNYAIYTLKTANLYSVAIYIGTTAVYAESNAENSSEIDQILYIIDYTAGIHVETNVVFNSIIRPSFSLVLLFLTRLSTNWLWSVVCASANVVEDEANECCSENGNRIFIDNKHMCG